MRGRGRAGAGRLRAGEFLTDAHEPKAAQIEDDRLSDVNSDRRYIEATRDVLQKQGGLWFYDESFVISRRRE